MRPEAPAARPPLLPRGVAVAAALAALALAVPSPAAAKGGAYRDSPHGNRDRGVRRVPGLPRGDCGHCHGAAKDESGRRGDGTGHARLFAANDNTLCLGCHSRAAGSYQGDQRYAESAHGNSPAVVWPGPRPPARPSTDAGKCVNCHDPHGVKDAGGVVPHLLRLRGADQCLACHRGDPGPDVASALTKAYRHPLVEDPPLASFGQGARAGAAQPFVETGTCGACHNPHVAAGEALSPSTAGTSRSLLGVQRVRPSGGSATGARAFGFVPATDTVLVREYEVCFKCHSGAAGRPARGVDVAAALNPANPSFHPVEAQGRNRGIDRRAFAQGWNAERLVTCSDCHGPDEELLRGPHGSSYAHILRRRHPVGSAEEQVLETDLCFQCHAYRTYGESQGAAHSRYPGHASHAAKGYGCWACHEAHGSATLPALLALRPSGMAAYAQDAAGGTCTATCHAKTPQKATYRITYGR
jgi:predicted CXXCH cytochrome family protein